MSFGTQPHLDVTRYEHQIPPIPVTGKSHTQLRLIPLFGKMQIRFPNLESAMAFAKVYPGSLVVRAQDFTVTTTCDIPVDQLPANAVVNNLLTDAKEELARLKTEAGAERELIAKRKGEIAELSSRIADLSQNRANLENEHSELREVRAGVAAARTKVAELSKKAFAIEKKISELQEAERAFKEDDDLISRYLHKNDISLLKQLERLRTRRLRAERSLLQDCKCLGANSSCAYCFGRGYITIDGNGQISAPP